MAALWLAAALAWLGEIATAAVRQYDPNTGTRLRWPQAFMLKSVDGRARISGAILVALILAVPIISAARFWRENDLSRDRRAQEFVSLALADAAPDALILTSSDGPTFALWYAVYGLGQRPDVAPTNVSLVSFEWYRRALAGRHPDLAAALSVFDPSRPAAWLEAVPGGRPLYRAETLAVHLPGYDERPAGSLVRLIRQPNE
jgi:hypothetical protein